jgi:hypothetical protein
MQKPLFSSLMGLYACIHAPEDSSFPSLMPYLFFLGRVLSFFPSLILETIWGDWERGF